MENFIFSNNYVFAKVGITSILALLCTVVGLFIYRLYFHPLKHIPGPLLARSSYLYFQYHAIICGRLAHVLPELHKTYGPVIRVAPDRVHVDDPAFLKILFDPRERFRKSDYFYSNVGINDASVITMTDVKTHRARRKVLGPLFTPQAVLRHLPAALEELQKLQSRLNEGNESKTVDLHEVFSQYFVDFNCRTMFNLYMPKEEALDIFDSSINWAGEIHLFQAFPILVDFGLMFPTWIARLVAPGLVRFQGNIARCIEHAKLKSNQNFKRSDPTDGNIIDLLLTLDKDGKPLSDREIADETFALFFAATHTSTMSSLYSLYFILTHPHVLRKLKKELATLPKNEFGDPQYENPTDLSYLAAILKETLRLRPVAGPGYVPRIVPPGGVSHGDFFIPAGIPWTNISTSSYVVGNNPMAFKDALVFDPERWLGPQAKYLEEYFVPFAKGPRKCLGKHLTFLTVPNAIAALLSNFEVTLHENADDAMVWYDHTVLVSKSHLKACVTPIGEKATSQRPSDTVLLPNLLVSWASFHIEANPNYGIVAPAAESWFQEICELDEKEHRPYKVGNFGLLAALYLPKVSALELRTVHDFMNWFWTFDDAADEGKLKDQPHLIQLEIDKFLPILSDASEPVSAEQDPLNYTLWLVLQRMQQKATTGTMHRFREAIKEYALEVLEQSLPESLEISNSIEAYINHHRKSTGTMVLLSQCEYAIGIDLPDFVFRDQNIQRIEELMQELILLKVFHSNDVYSYGRETKIGDQHNIIHLFRMEGMTQQEALNKAGELVFSRYEEWDRVATQIPQWSERVDTEVHKYVEAARLLVVACSNWSFQTERYFGKENEDIKKTRRVPAIPFGY